MVVEAHEAPVMREALRKIHDVPDRCLQLGCSFGVNEIPLGSHADVFAKFGAVVQSSPAARAAPFVE